MRGLGPDIAQNEGAKVGVIITLATAICALISGVIVLVAAINSAHTFMMLVADRRSEIGVLRAVEASRAQVRALFLNEAIIVGALSGVVGVLLARLPAMAADAYSATRIADFPFKPTTYSSFSWELVASTLVFAMLFCLLGAAIPASRAPRLDPARALAGH